MANSLKATFAVGAIARAAGVPVPRAQYYIRTHGFQPLGRSGPAKVYSASVARKVVRALRERSRIIDQVPVMI